MLSVLYILLLHYFKKLNIFNSLMLEFKYPQCSAEGQMLNVGFIREGIFI